MYNEFTMPIDTRNVQFDPVRSEWDVTTFERCNPEVSQTAQLCAANTYRMEARRFYDEDNRCQTCPYHLDPYWTLPNVWSPRFDNLLGPCFDNAPSLQTTCTQHPALAPKGFFGVYHFPMQMPLTQTVWDQSPYTAPEVPLPMHLFLMSDVSSDPYTPQRQPKDPSMYGLGKKAVHGWLSTLQFRNRTTNQVNEALTTAFLRPYSTINGVEQWLKYAQFFCYPTCHRDARYTRVGVRPADVEGKPENAYLTVHLGKPVGSGLTRCTQCPSRFAAYEWNDDLDAPYHPRINIMAMQCYPWFGALPSVRFHTLMGHVLNMTVVQHNNWMQDGVVLPLEQYVVAEVPCPVNTYNRVCAHAKRHYYASGQMARYQCTPCPPGGFHTGGRTGQWYCLPPPGHLFTTELLRRMPLDELWANRDLLNSKFRFPEFECGYLPEHCLQQPECTPNGMLPEVFNERFIFSRLLHTRPCAVGFFCPDAFTERACPKERPWSPANSSTEANCSCRAGTYLQLDPVSLNATCVACTPRCTVPGTYLPFSQCMGKNGATEDAPCLPCTNVPNSAISTGVGFELLGGDGICPFACTQGALLSLSAAGGGATPTICAARYTCTPLTQPPRNADGQYLYYSPSPVLPVDALLVNADQGVCQRALMLTSTLNALLPTEWSPQITSCFQRCSNPQQLCYAVSLLEGGLPATPWYTLSAPAQCAPCPGLAPLPQFATVQPYVALEQHAACVELPRIQCSQDAPAYYFNRSAWACQLCKDRELQVCPSGTRLRGQGCLFVQTPFNLTAPAVDCQRCTLAIPSASLRGVRFLNYNSPNGTSATGGCAIDACAPLPPAFYWSTPCVGDQPGVQRPCSLDDCPAWQFRAAPCSSETDRVCTNCTTFRPGHVLIITCDPNTDSQWRPCASGFYCPGNGSELACPTARTSQPGARLLSDCYCRVGTREDSATGRCVPMRCPGTVQDPNLPGQSFVSTHYMTLDPQTLSSTVCLPCSPDALAVTQGTGLELTSCVCPPGRYAAALQLSSLNASLSPSIQCLPCASRTPPACTDPRELPTPCARTLVPQRCDCARVPYSALLPMQTVAGTNCAAACLSTFTQQQGTQAMLQRAPLQGWPSPPGSMLYIHDQGSASSSSWARLLTAEADITAFATTGELDDTVLATLPYHAEYVFWSVQDGTSVFAQLLPFPSQEVAQWQVFGAPVDAQGNRYTIRHLAVSRWTPRGSRDAPIYVAALVSVSSPSASGSGVQRLSLTTFQPDGTFATAGALNASILLLSGTPMQPVAFLHSSTALGSGTPQAGGGGVFYVAYNTPLGACGGLLLVNPVTRAVVQPPNPLCGPATPALRGFTVRMEPSSPYPVAYVLLESAGLFRLDTLQGIVTNTRPLIAATNNHFALVSVSPGVLLTLNAANPNHNTLSTTDTAQWVWGSIAGLPSGTAPSFPHIAVTGINPTAVFLVVANASALFLLSAKSCALGSYWDGVACVPHACLKVPQCDATRELDIITNQCVCIPGFFETSSSAPCQPCPVGSYCLQGRRTACPGTFVTTLQQRSTSFRDCICSVTGYYYLPASADCVVCTPNAWCPNTWSVLACPGTTSSATASAVGRQFPVACACQPGFTGPSCAPCPAGAYCPAPLTSTGVVNNLAIIYTNLTEALAMPILTQTLVTYFNTPGTQLSGIATARDLPLYVANIPPTNHTPLPAIVVMLQLPPTANAQQLQSWGTVLLLAFRTAGFRSVATVPTTGNPVTQSGIPHNAPTQCLTGKVPSAPVASTCVCAPGYEPNGQQCRPCAANTFKEAPGADTNCIPCPVGLVSLAAAAACRQPSLSSGGDGADAAAAGNDTGLLIGAVAGGVGGLLLLLFVFQYFFLSTTATR
jgi:hypothetical protein